MKWVFWISALTVAYIYGGYPAWLWLRSRWRPRPVRRAQCTPSVSVVLVVRNEAGVIQQKMRNLAASDYPADLLQLVVVSDGSSDGTAELLSRLAEDSRVYAILKPEGRGKAAGLNDAIRAASGDIVVFSDARQQIEPAAIGLLMENFADAAVGCVSGELMLGDPEAGESGENMGLYWKIEKSIRQMEAATGSVMGATGALYAVRRELLVPVPPDTILDDVYIPMSVVRQGFRVTFDSRARAWDLPHQGTRREFQRKVRTLSGNYQLVQLAPWLLTSENPARFEFVSHKLMRLLSPFALAAMLVSSALIAGPVYRGLLLLQVCFYGLSALQLVSWIRGPLARVSNAAFSFVVLNAAAVFAFANFVTGRKAVWTP